MEAAICFVQDWTTLYGSQIIIVSSFFGQNLVGKVR